MSYLAPSEFVSKMVDAGESKLLMSTKDTLIRAYMAGAILALAAAFAVTVTVNTGNPLIGAAVAGDHRLAPVASAQVDAFDGDRLECNPGTVGYTAANGSGAIKRLHAELRKA